jgi:hypothetical protein
MITATEQTGKSFSLTDLVVQATARAVQSVSKIDTTLTVEITSAEANTMRTVTPQTMTHSIEAALKTAPVSCYVLYLDQDCLPIITVRWSNSQIQPACQLLCSSR